MRSDRTQIAWLVATVAAILLLASLAVSDSQKVRSDHARKESVAQLSFAARTVGDPVAAFTALLFVVAVVQAALFVWQLRFIRISMADAKTAAEAARDAAKAADDTLKSNRAWVCPAGFKALPSENTKVGEDPTIYPVGFLFCLLFENAGRSPAKNANVYADFVLVDRNESPPHFQTPSWIKNSTGGGIIGPGKVFDGPFRAIVKKDYEEFFSSQRSIVVYTAVGYNDVFDNVNRRITEMCMELRYDGQQINTTTGSKSMNIGSAYIGKQNTAA